MKDDFYVGWSDRVPPGTARLLKVTVAGIAALGIALAVVLSWGQGTIGSSVFEWGTVKDFSGILISRPYPHLLVSRPGLLGDRVPVSSYPLVRPFKFGLDGAIAGRFDGLPVTLKGTLIHRAGYTMVEVVEDSIMAAKAPAERGKDPVALPLGRGTWVGEIVDSKCFLGVMNPGAFIPHRSCAIRCISGGIPPVLAVRAADGRTVCLLLVSTEGGPVNQQVLDKVAEPVEITGDLERQGEWLILRAAPATYRRIGR